MFGVVVVYVRSPSSATQRPKLDPGAVVRTCWDGLALAKPVALEDADMSSLHVCGCQLSMSRAPQMEGTRVVVESLDLIRERG